MLVAYVATCSVTFFTASLAILISTFGRRVRQAVLIVYLLEVAWLTVPPILDGMCRWLFPAAYLWFGPINNWVLATNPLALVYLSAVNTRGPMFMRGGGLATMLDSFVWMVGLQLALGTFFLSVAVWQLRPTFRRQEESTRRLFGARSKLRRPRWLNRPECGADAMLWKERHFARTDFFTKMVVLPATVFLTVCVLLAGRFDELVRHSFADVWQRGYSSFSHERTHFNETLCAVSPIYVSLWLLAVAGASASAVSFEREQDTWDSLIASPLSGWEILRGKGVGAIWGLRGFGGLLSLFWLVGLAAGAIHPLGLLLALLITGLLTWFVLALGIRASLSARKTSRALTITIAVLVFLNLGYLAVVYPILQVVRDPYESQQYVMIGCTPLIAGYALLSYPQMTNLIAGLRDGGLGAGIDHREVALAAVLLAGYAIAAAVLTLRSLRRFDEVVDRPRRLAVDPDMKAVAPRMIGIVQTINGGTGIPWN